MAKESIVREKAFTFAIRIVKLYQFLSTEKKEFVLSKQILRSGTSIGAISKKEFSNKISIAYKRQERLLIGCVYWKPPALLKNVSSNH